MISWAPAGSVKALFEATPRADNGAASVAVGQAANTARTAQPFPQPSPVARPSEPLLSAPRPVPTAVPASVSPQPRSETATSNGTTTSAAAGKQIPPFWVGISLLFFFPIGFLLLSMHPTLRSKKAWWAAGVAWALLLMLAPRTERADTGDGGGAKGVAPETAEVKLDSPSTEGTASTRPKGMHSVGDTFTLGDFQYCITGVNTSKAIGTTVFGEFMGERASPGAMFVIISYTIENLGSESQTVLSDDFKIQDSASRMFKPSSDANVALLTESDDKDFLLSELQPGIPRAMKQAFELPEKALDAPLTIVVPEKGFFTSGKAQVRVTVR